MPLPDATKRSSSINSPPQSSPLAPPSAPPPIDLFPITNPFRQYSESENFPPFLEAVDDQNNYEDSFLSLNLSIGAQAALNEHIRHVAKHGLDAEWSFQLGCVEATEKNESIAGITSPSRLLDAEWDRLLDASMSHVSLTSSFVCDPSGLLLAHRKAAQKAKISDVDSTPCIVQPQLATRRTESLALNSSPHCIKLDYGGHEDEDDKNGSSYFDSSRVWALATPERVRSNSKGMETAGVVIRRGSHGGFTDSHDDDEEGKESPPLESFEATSTPYRQRTGKFLLQSRGSFSSSPHGSLSNNDSPISSFMAMDISRISGIAASQVASPSTYEVGCHVPSVAIFSDCNENIECVEKTSPFPSPKFLSSLDVERLSGSAGDIQEPPRSPFLKLDWSAMDNEDNEKRTLNKVPDPDSEGDDQSGSVAAFPEVFTINRENPCERPNQVSACIEMTNDLIETNGDSQIHARLDLCGEEMTHEDGPQQDMGSSDATTDNGPFSMREKCEIPPLNQDADDKDKELPYPSATPTKNGISELNKEKDGSPSSSRKTELSPSKILKGMSLSPIAIQAADAASRFAVMSKQLNSLRGRLNEAAKVQESRELGAVSSSRTDHKTPLKTSETMSMSTPSPSPAIHTDETISPSSLPSRQSTDYSNSTSTKLSFFPGSAIDSMDGATMTRLVRINDSNDQNNRPSTQASEVMMSSKSAVTMSNDPSVKCQPSAANDADEKSSAVLLGIYTNNGRTAKSSLQLPNDSMRLKQSSRTPTMTRTRSSMLHQIDRRRFRTVVPIRVYLDSSFDESFLYAGHDSFGSPMPDQALSYARLYSQATEKIGKHNPNRNIFRLV